MSLVTSLTAVIPIYNGEKWIGRCLDSLFAQELRGRELQVVAVDDGSKDGTAEILDSYSAREKRLHIIHQANQGTAAALTAGIQMATGDVVGVISQDCFAAPDWMASVADAFEADDKIGIVRGQVLPAGEINVPICHCTYVLKPSRSYDGVTIAFRAAALDQVGRCYDVSLSRAGDDADIGWRVVEAGWQDHWIDRPLSFHEVIPLTFWRALGQIKAAARMPLLVRKHPGMRARLKLRFLAGSPWQYIRLSCLAMTLLTAVLTIWSLAALLIVLTCALYVIEAVQQEMIQCSPKGKFLTLPAYMFVSETLGEMMLCWGSLRYNSLVL
ncbi:MAG: glycosyltransferase family 2 protein [Dehalococcoidales bacterium]|nr:glycosyltransferase family 2 protein [Dehalococcoidales bacterium]